MIDWDEVVLEPNFGVFGEPATYTPAVPAGSAAFGITIIFDRAYTREYLMEDGSTGFTSMSPTAGIREADFTALPQQNDHVFVPRLNLTFIVRDYRPDSHGAGRLFLNRV